jgi:hypothetical protein
MPTPMVLNDPADILSLVPFVLGFHPTDSVVVLGLRGRQMIFQARLPGTTRPSSAASR